MTSVSTRGGGSGGRSNGWWSRPRSPLNAIDPSGDWRSTDADPRMWPAGLSRSARSSPTSCSSSKSRSTIVRQYAVYVTAVVERLRCHVLGEPLARRVHSVLLLQLGAVAKHQLGQPCGVPACEDRRRETGPAQDWQVAAMVQVRVADDYRIELFGREGTGSQLRRRNCRRPWKSPASTSICVAGVRTRNRLPVTVPVAPWNESVIVPWVHCSYSQHRRS